MSNEPACRRCWDSGWYPEVVPGTEDDYIPDYQERYCDCPAADRLMRRDGVKTADAASRQEPPSRDPLASAEGEGTP